MHTVTKFQTGASVLDLPTGQSNSVVRKIESRFPVAKLTRFLDRSGLDESVILRILHLTTQTLARRMKTGRLSESESDRLYRLSRVFSTAVHLFNGNAENAAEWLQSPARLFGGRTPLSRCQTEEGARDVEDLIGRLEHGVFS